MNGSTVTLTDNLIPEADFYPCLDTFLTANTQWNRSVAMTGDRTGIDTATLSAVLAKIEIDADFNENSIRMMGDMRAIATKGPNNTFA